MFRTRWIPHVFACLLLLVPSAPILCAPADSPQREKKEIEEAVAKLGSADPAEREAATRALRIIGEPAQAALKEAAAGDDIEAARRASEILRSLRYGIRPDTPVIITDRLAQYRQAAARGARETVAPAVAGLAESGPAGLRVLTR